MKKNYFYPETETISVESGAIMGPGSGNKGGDTLDEGPGSNPTGGGWGASSRKGLYM